MRRTSRANPIGLGGLLVQSLIADARALGIPRVIALTREVPFFERCGFVVVPDGFEPDGGLFIEAERRSRGGVRRTRDPREAVTGADVVYTDTWTSMGQEKDAEWRRVMFAGFQVNEELMSAARPDALFMHCLPAHRGAEVTDAVMDGPQSIVMEQAENRLHLQKGLMAELVRAGGARGRSPRERQAVAAK